MRKIFVQEMVTIDGFFAGVQGEIDWHIVDDEFNEYAVSILNNIGTLMLGRVTYDLMASYWPTPEGSKDNAAIAQMMNTLPKVVFSKSLEKADWNNTTLVHELYPDEILKMKQLPGKDIAIFGSGTIVSALAGYGLIDQYRLIVNPVILGKGKALFVNLEKKLNLKLVNTKEFKSGNVLLCYEPNIHGTSSA